MPARPRLRGAPGGAAPQLGFLPRNEIRGHIVSNPATIWSNASPRAWRDFHLPALRRLVCIFREWRAMRRAERELYALDDRMLKDIGVARGGIPFTVRAWRSASLSQLPF